MKIESEKKERSVSVTFLTLQFVCESEREKSKNAQACSIDIL